MNDRKSEVTIDLSDVASPLELQQRLSRSLEFPDWYGKNWDAFWDAITGLVDMPHQLRLLGWQTLKDRLPLDAELLRACLEKMQKELPGSASTVVYDIERDTLPDAVRSSGRVEGF
ncbi:barstar family protein [Variovorax sp. DAIF25]|uniref:barstar family protein n=1 Tax=Variovorax sp. DAIF25 TaxID=3080983 RepID=UPI003D6A5136